MKNTNTTKFQIIPAKINPTFIIVNCNEITTWQPPRSHHDRSQYNNQHKTKGCLSKSQDTTIQKLLQTYIKIPTDHIIKSRMVKPEAVQNQVLIWDADVRYPNIPPAQQLHE